MQKLTRRKKLITGGFLIVAVIWAVDSYTRPDAPAAALGATQPKPVKVVKASMGDPVDRAELERFLSDQQAPLAPLLLDGLERELFAPSSDFLAALSTPRAGDPPPKPAPESATSQPSDFVPFERRHKLEGVLTGKTPMALIDGKLYRRGAEVDGMRLVQIRRDAVVLEAGQERVLLSVPRLRSPGDPPDAAP